MAIIKMEDLNRRFTEVVAQYIAQGLTMNLNAMSGTQGEIGKVALANDKVVYFIYMDRGHDGNIMDGRMYDTMNIKVEMHERDCRDLIDNWHTYWLGKGELVFEEVYYQITDRRDGKVWVADKADADSILDMRHARRKARGESWANWKKVRYDVDTVVNVVKAKTGRKRVFAENIVSVEKHTSSQNCWRITYVFSGKQNTVCLHMA